MVQDIAKRVPWVHVLALVVTVLTALLPAMITIGRLTTRIEVMQETLQGTIQRFDQHVRTEGHPVMVERVRHMQSDLTAIKNDTRQILDQVKRP